ncbi:putative S-adenosyl-L-methionine-dependent methyltransferase [Medicago truncatula]|uniref:Putative S-adenosyl-L-methionine-dependent methyltransferase n=1 Tax=Medicago truncatula TaxID=3880 RepID=A0A396HA91_MEDTR|nr:putative S-adenosyl-L-methionine-dependent methyltransferase [Medicago truncatula]
MAELYVNQAREYSNARPSYPPQLFQFIASKTPSHNLVWDVATGSGQAPKSLATLYNNVVATDASEKQLEFATLLHNVRYQHTPSTMSVKSSTSVRSWPNNLFISGGNLHLTSRFYGVLEQMVSSQGTIDLVTIAQALHWFDLSTFYKQVNWVLKKPHGIIATWCYNSPRVNDAVDALHDKENYETVDFPFGPVEGVDHTGPFEFVAETVMDFDDFLTYIRSRSSYQTSKNNGVELLKEDVIENFKLARGEDGQKTVKFQVYLRIGRVMDA